MRWYGGTNLGVGGLVRAYGGALAAGARRRAHACGASAPRRCSSATGTSRRRRSCAACTAHGGRDLDHAYGEHGVELRFLVPLARCDALAACLRDATRGAVTPERLGESVIRSC